MKEAIAIAAIKLGIKAASWLVGKYKARKVAKEISEAKDKPADMPCNDG